MISHFHSTCSFANLQSYACMSDMRISLSSGMFCGCFIFCVHYDLNCPYSCCYFQKRTPDMWDSWFQGFSSLVMGLILVFCYHWCICYED